MSCRASTEPLGRNRVSWRSNRQQFGRVRRWGEVMLFVGDDWAQDHHDVYLIDEAGACLAATRLPEGLAGIGQFHELVADRAEDPGEVIIGIETDRGMWVGALAAAGYQVYAINPRSVARYRDRHGSRARNLMPLMRSCWPIWSAPIGTTTARSTPTVPGPKRSRCWPGPIRA